MGLLQRTTHIIESEISRAGVIGTCYDDTLDERRKRRSQLRFEGRGNQTIFEQTDGAKPQNMRWHYL